MPDIATNSFQALILAATLTNSPAEKLGGVLTNQSTFPVRTEPLNQREQRVGVNELGLLTGSSGFVQKSSLKDTNSLAEYLARYGDTLHDDGQLTNGAHFSTRSYIFSKEYHPSTYTLGNTDAIYAEHNPIGQMVIRTAKEISKVGLTNTAEIQFVTLKEVRQVASPGVLITVTTPGGASYAVAVKNPSAVTFEVPPASSIGIFTITTTNQGDVHILTFDTHGNLQHSNQFGNLISPIPAESVIKK